MKIKNFLIAGIVGGITDFLLGFLFYGMLFKDYFEEHQKQPDLLLTFLGCLSFGMLISYIYVKWANLVTFVSGLMGGAVIGLLYGLTNNFFKCSMGDGTMDYGRFALDVAILIAMVAIVGGIVATVNGMFSKNTNMGN